MAIEKLRGFVADHQAKIVAIDGNRVQLEIDDRPASRLRRLTDRPVAFRMELRFEEERFRHGRGGPEEEKQPPDRGVARTQIKVSVSPRKDRDRRRSDVTARAREVLISFRSYLIASEEEPSPPVGRVSRAKQILAPWLTPK